MVVTSTMFTRIVFRCRTIDTPLNKDSTLIIVDGIDELPINVLDDIADDHSNFGSEIQPPGSPTPYFSTKKI